MSEKRQCLRAMTDGRCSAPNCMCPVIVPLSENSARSVDVQMIEAACESILENTRCALQAALKNAAPQVPGPARSGTIGREVNLPSRPEVSTPAVAAPGIDDKVGETPRTDAQLVKGDVQGPGAYRMVVFARQLERELAEEKAYAKRLFDRLAPSVEYVEGTPVGYGEDEIDRLGAEVTALKERLDRSAIEPIEVCSALRWTMDTLESSLAGKVIVNADEVILHAKRILEKWENPRSTDSPAVLKPGQARGAMQEMHDKRRDHEDDNGNRG